MRQAGVLAAAGLIALEEMPSRLCQDHANARLLAEAMAALPQVEIDLGTVQTNIVIFKVRRVEAVAPLLAKMKKRGVVVGSAAQDQIRFVTHYDVDRAMCERATRVAAEVIAAG
jgi:threonine aldolase